MAEMVLGIDEREGRIKVHEYWMAFRREYHKVKDGHKPKLTHEEVEEMLYQIMRQIKNENLN